MVGQVRLNRAGVIQSGRSSGRLSAQSTGLIPSGRSVHWTDHALDTVDIASDSVTNVVGCDCVELLTLDLCVHPLLNRAGCRAGMIQSGRLLCCDSIGQVVGQVYRGGQV